MAWDDVECWEIEKVVATRETTMALLVVVNEQEFWVPKSQIQVDSEVYRPGDKGKLVVSFWWAEKKGLA